MDEGLDNIPDFEQRAVGFSNTLRQIRDEYSETQLWIYRDTISDYKDKSDKIEALNNPTDEDSQINDMVFQITGVSPVELSDIQKNMIYKHQDEADQMLSQNKAMISFTWECKLDGSPEEVENALTLRDWVKKKLRVFNPDVMEVEEYVDFEEEEDRRIGMYMVVVFES